MVGMSSSANSDDDAALRGHAVRLADGIDAALPGWVERVVALRWEQWRGEPVPEAIADQARDAGGRARSDVGPRVRALLLTDVDAQPTGPLALVREAVVHPTRVLADAGMPEVERDEHAVRLFPDDVYDLAPAAFADLDPDLHEPGLIWGAAKAHVVLARRRAEGRR